MMDAAHLSDLRGYDLAWASIIVKRAWQHLQDAFEAEGKAESLEVLRPFVDGSGRTPPNQEEAAKKLGVPVATLRTWLWRLRQRYREALRREVASTVSDPDDVDQELHYLYEILTASASLLKLLTSNYHSSMCRGPADLRVGGKFAWAPTIGRV